MLSPFVPGQTYRVAKNFYSKERDCEFSAGEELVFHRDAYDPKTERAVYFFRDRSLAGKAFEVADESEADQKEFQAWVTEHFEGTTNPEQVPVTGRVEQDVSAKPQRRRWFQSWFGRGR